MIFRTNKYYLLILLAAFIVEGCGNSSGNYDEIESSASSESTTSTDNTTTDNTTTSSGLYVAVGSSGTILTSGAILTSLFSSHEPDINNIEIDRLFEGEC